MKFLFCFVAFFLVALAFSSPLSGDQDESLAHSEGADLVQKPLHIRERRDTHCPRDPMGCQISCLGKGRANTGMCVGNWCNCF